jgi:hypothetical protein
MIMQIRRLAEGVNVDSQKRQMVIEAAIARAIATNLQLPTSPLELGAFQNHYANQHAIGVRDILSQINEVFVIRTKETESLTLKLYRLRYDLVFQPNDRKALEFFSAMSSVDDTVIPAPVAECIKEATQNEAFRSEVVRVIEDISRAVRADMSPNGEPAQ